MPIRNSGFFSSFLIRSVPLVRLTVHSEAIPPRETIRILKAKLLREFPIDFHAISIRKLFLFFHRSSSLFLCGSENLFFFLLILFVSMSPIVSAALARNNTWKLLDAVTNPIIQTTRAYPAQKGIDKNEAFSISPASPIYILVIIAGNTHPMIRQDRIPPKTVPLKISHSTWR